MFNRIVAATFENIVEADHIGFDICVRIGNGVAYSITNPDAYIESNMRQDW